MSRVQAKVVRCAIYTRKSSEEGLDQAFNSLHAQREACEAYIQSQAGEGWKIIARAYDDGGFSGGNLERPALTQLLADVDAGRVDTVVVYKVDRLTRSLSDFARIVDRLDAAGASFVSVTQAFNTTSSMGRLTLNVLLSFAQFEREVTGERIRDKIAASKAKGMWMGGALPLGYDAPTNPTTRALVVNAAEAEVVRYIFRTYLELGSVHALVRRLDAEGIRSKVRVTRAGRKRGGTSLTRGAVFHLLRNRTYVGEIPHGAKHYPGAHEPIIGRELFEAVQALLEGHRRSRRDRPLRSSSALLKGLLFDAQGEPMSPSFTHSAEGRVYRYYVSAPLQQGRAATGRPAALGRVAALEVEGLVQRYLADWLESPSDTDLGMLLAPVRRIEIDAEEVRVIVQRSKLPRAARALAEAHGLDAQLAVLTIPMRCRLRGGRSWIVPSDGLGAARPARRDPVLIKGLMQAHQLAAAMGWSAKDGSLEPRAGKAPASAYERKLVRLAFLAPDIQQQILSGRQPASLNLETLVGGAIPVCWEEQRERFVQDQI